MEPLRAMLEDPSVRKTAQNAKYDLLALRRAGVTLRGLEFDTMLASYVLELGSAAAPALDEAAAARKDPQIRARATALAKRIR